MRWPNDPSWARAAPIDSGATIASVAQTTAIRGNTRRMLLRSTRVPRRPFPLAQLISGARSYLPLDHHPLDLGDRLGGIEPLRAGLGAVHDGVAAIEPERVLENVEPLAGRLVAAVVEPAARLQQRGGAEEALAVPPVARAGGRAAGAQNALIEAVELLAILVALPPFLLRGRRGGAQPRLDQRVLGVEIAHVRHQVLDHRHVRQRVDL